jgi:dienelactone hydrolase
MLTREDRVMSQSIERPVGGAGTAVLRVHRGRIGLSGGVAVLVGAQLVIGLGLVLLALVSDVSQLGRVAGVVLAVAATAALVFLTLHPRAWVRGTVELAGGVTGLCVGGGIGPVWLATSGLSVTAIIAIASLVAGLVLLVVAGWTLVRATPGWWRLAWLPIGFLILQFILVPVAGAIYGTHPPRTPLSAPVPAQAERVTFPTPDGVELVGWYTPPSNRAAIILLPGSGGDKGSTVGHGAVLASHGYGVLALDSRGTGDSGGIGNAWGWHGLDDIAGAVAWLRTRQEVDGSRFGVLGLSMGGEEALTAAAADLGLSAVVAEGVSARVPADLAYLPDDLTGAIHRIDAGIMWGLASLMSQASPPIPLVEAVARAADEVPILVIVGTAADEAAAAPRLQAAASALRVWNVDAPHIAALARFPDEWEARVVGFFDEALPS